MFFVSEKSIKDLVTQSQVNDSVEAAFRNMDTGAARNFPVVREILGYADAIFGFKSGVDLAKKSLGVKAGGLWPRNAQRSLTNHQSNIALFDIETGQLHAVVEGGYLTALRTASASAISIRHLARPDSETLGILGTGGQAIHQIKAALEIHSFKRVIISGRSLEKAQQVAEELDAKTIEIEVQDIEQMARRSDVIITVTSARAPLVEFGWVRPGTHIAAMGTDTVGKQELDPALIDVGSVFTDSPVQAVALGECQHAFSAGLKQVHDLIQIGTSLNEKEFGRLNESEITIFDGTGVGLQDVAAAQLALEVAQANSRAINLQEI